MTEKKYLKKFKKLLKIYKIDDTDDIVRDIELHFDVKRKQGFEDSQIITELGSPEQNFFEYVEKKQLHDHCKTINKKRITVLIVSICLALVFACATSVGGYFLAVHIKSQKDGPYEGDSWEMQLGEWDTELRFQLYAICENKVLLQKIDDSYSIPSWTDRLQFHNQTKDQKLFFVQSSFRRKDEERTTVFRGYNFVCTPSTQCNFELENGSSIWVDISEIGSYLTNDNDCQDYQCLSKINFDTTTLFLKNTLNSELNLTLNKILKPNEQKEFVFLINNNSQLDVPSFDINSSQLNIVDKSNSDDIANIYFSFEILGKKFDCKATQMLIKEGDNNSIAYVVEDINFDDSTLSEINQKFDTITAFNLGERNDIFEGYTKEYDSEFDLFLFQRYSYTCPFDIIF